MEEALTLADAERLHRVAVREIHVARQMIAVQLTFQVIDCVLLLLILWRLW